MFDFRLFNSYRNGWNTIAYGKSSEVLILFSTHQVFWAGLGRALELSIEDPLGF